MASTGAPKKTMSGLMSARLFPLHLPSSCRTTSPRSTRGLISSLSNFFRQLKHVAVAKEPESHDVRKCFGCARMRDKLAMRLDEQLILDPSEMFQCIDVLRPAVHGRPSAPRSKKRREHAPSLQNALLLQQAEEVMREGRAEVAGIQLLRQGVESFRSFLQVVHVEDCLRAVEKVVRCWSASAAAFTVWDRIRGVLWQLVLHDTSQ